MGPPPLDFADASITVQQNRCHRCRADHIFHEVLALASLLSPFRPRQSDEICYHRRNGVLLHHLYNHDVPLHISGNFERAVRQRSRRSHQLGQRRIYPMSTDSSSVEVAAPDKEKDRCHDDLFHRTAVRSSLGLLMIPYFG